jgi:hypothetical protein
VLWLVGILVCYHAFFYSVLLLAIENCGPFYKFSLLEFYAIKEKLGTAIARTLLKLWLIASSLKF